VDNLEQLIAGRQRQQREDNNPEPTPEKKRQEPKPQDTVTEEKVKNKIQEIERNNNIPIYEVTDAQNKEKQSFISYRILVDGAKANQLTDPSKPGFKALKSAYAEALVLKSNRNAVISGAVIYEPIDKVASLTSIITDPGIRELAKRTLDRINNKTPDILTIATTSSIPVGRGRVTIFPKIRNYVDPENPLSGRVKTENFIGKTVISPTEVTTSENFDKIKEKADKFRSYVNPFRSDTKDNSIHYIPILALDRDVYEGFKDDQKIKLIKVMNSVNGRIVLIKDLNNTATKLATEAANGITNVVNSSKQSTTPNTSNTSEVAATNSTLANSQTTLSMGETAEVAQANNAKLQEILARMQTRDRSETSNNIPATTSEIGSITTTPNTATVNTTDRDTAFVIPTSQNTALTGGRSTTALTGSIGTTALTGGTSTTALTGSVGTTALTGGTSTTALTGGKTQEPSQLQQGMALS
jgi:hypothetical protein